MSQPDDDWAPPSDDPATIENAKERLRDIKTVQAKALRWAYFAIAALVALIVIIVLVK